VASQLDEFDYVAIPKSQFVACCRLLGAAAEVEPDVAYPANSLVLVRLAEAVLALELDQ
jgi:hypothetical protein